MRVAVVAELPKGIVGRRAVVCAWLTRDSEGMRAAADVYDEDALLRLARAACGPGVAVELCADPEDECVT